MGKVAAYSATFSWDGASVAGLTNISPAGMSADMIDVSNHLSTSAFREYVAGMLSAGEVSIEGHFDSSDTTGQQAMWTDFQARATKEMIITFPTSTGTTLTANAYLTSLKYGDLSIDGSVGFSATVMISGVPTWAFAASTGLTTPFFAMSGSGTLTPAASGSVYDYTYVLPNGTGSCTVTPTATAGTITVNGNTVATGVASSAITVPEDALTTITIVVTETAKSPKTYTIRAYQAGA